MASRVSSASGRSAVLWLIGGSIAMGFGIWSMHFIGMLAFSVRRQLG
jgi:NO-binding membrane sensor protein with MHYT domain